MAHRFDASLYFTGTANPLTTNYTCGSTATLLILGIGDAGAAGRVGTPFQPNYGGRAFFNVNVSTNIGGEMVGELWGLLNPSTGQAYSVSIPNTAGHTLRCFLSSYNASIGYTSAFDTSVRLSSTTANPSANITTSVNQELVVTQLVSGANAVIATAYVGAFIAVQPDMGNAQEAMQWYINPTISTIKPGFLTISEDSGLVISSWKENLTAVPYPPFLLLPGDGSIDQPINPVLVWQPANAGSRPLTYYLQLSSSTAFSNNDVSLRNLNSTSYAVTGLAPNTTYYWRVNASGGIGTGLSGWTTPESFTTATTWGGILKYWTGAEWKECTSSGLKVYINSQWKIVPRTNMKIFRSDWDASWYPVRRAGVATPSSTLLDGLLAYWNLDESSGKALDSLGNYDGSLLNSPTQGASGKIGTAYTFAAASSQEVRVGEVTQLEVPQITVSVWVNVPASGYFCAASHINGTNTQGWSITTEATKMRFKVGNGTNTALVDSSTSVNTSTWIHCVLTSDGTNMKAFINGSQEAGSQSYPYSITYSTGVNANFRIGARGDTPSSFFTGSLDEVGVWNRALTQAEITELYNGGTGKTYPFG